MRYSHQTWRGNGIGIPLELSFKLDGCEKNCIQILNAKCQHRTCSLSFTIGTSRINKDVKSNKRSAVYLQNKQTWIKMQLLTTVKKNLYYIQTDRQTSSMCFQENINFSKVNSFYSRKKHLNIIHVSESDERINIASFICGHYKATASHRLLQLIFSIKSGNRGKQLAWLFIKSTKAHESTCYTLLV